MTTAHALPLAEASRRLRRPAGRPRTVSRDCNPAPPRPPRAEVSGTSAPVAGPHSERVPDTAVAVAWLFPPRVFDLEGAARYLSLSTWTVRELRAAGHLPALEVPGVRALRFDREALDRAVTAWGVR